MTSHYFAEPHYGLGRHRYDRDLHWLFCRYDSECGLKSNLGRQLDVCEMGITQAPAQPREPDVNLAAARRARLLIARLHRLPRVHQQVLMLHYTRPRKGVDIRDKQGSRGISEIEIAAAHKAWREL